MSGVPWGGSEQLWSETALALRRRGHDVVASVLRWPNRPAALSELARNGVRVAFRPRRRRLPGRTLQKCLKIFAPGAGDWSQRQWLRRSAADLVVISQGGPWDGVPWMLACRSLDIPYCSIVHANGEHWWPLDEALDGIRAALGGAQRVFFVSHANRELMELQCGMRLAHAEVIANPCKIDRTAAVPWPVGDGQFHLACVGRMTPAAKGQDVLLQVLAQPKWKNRPVQLHLYGTGPAERSIASLAALLGVANVAFHGHVADVREIWRTNHALVLPSRFEGLPLTIVEAMICGRPVITTAVAGNTELVEDGTNGFAAAAPTVALLDEAMEHAWSRRDEWAALGRRAREDALAAAPEDPVGEFTSKLLHLLSASGVPHAARPGSPSAVDFIPIDPPAGPVTDARTRNVAVP